MSSLGWLAQPAALPWVALVFGLCIGSFLNVVIHRLPRMMEREWQAQCAELAGTAAAAEGTENSPYNLVRPTALLVLRMAEPESVGFRSRRGMSFDFRGHELT